MKIRFETDDYVSTHGRHPRGYGAWHLDILYHNGRGGYDHGSITFTGTLTAAKEAAKATARGSCFGARECTINILP